MGREKNLFSDTCEASCLAAASLCAEESAAYVRDVYRLPSTYVREAVSLARSATSWQLAVRREGGDEDRLKELLREEREKVAASEAKRVELEGVLRRMVAEAGGVLG